MLRHSHKQIQKLWKKFSLSLSNFGVGALPFVAIVTLIAGFFVWYTNNRVFDEAEASGPATTIQFLQNTLQVSETQSNPVIPVVLDGVAMQEITFDYEIIGGTATANKDYNIEASATSTIPIGQRGFSLPLKLIDDKTSEGSETIQFSISNPTGGVNLGGNTIMELTINDSNNLETDPNFGLTQNISSLPNIQNTIPSTIPTFDITTTTSLPDLSLQGPNELTVTDELVLHLDANQITVPDGSPVPLWENNSPNGIDVEQSDVNKQPLLRENSFNGNKTIEFDGVDDTLFSSTPITTSTEVTIVTVSKAATNGLIAGLSNDSDSSLFSGNLKRTVGDLGRYGFSRNSATGAGVYDTIDDAQIDSIDISIHGTNTSDLEFYSNGTIATNRESNISENFVEANRYAFIGGNALNSDFFDSEIAEVLIYERRINEFELNEIECYLSSKYDITVNGCGDPLQLRFEANTVAGSDGDPVTSWTDSVQGIVTEQTNTANQPVLRTSGLNGQKYLEFNNDFLIATNENIFQGDEQTTFVVSEENQNSQGFVYSHVPEGTTGNVVGTGVDKQSSTNVRYAENSSNRLASGGEAHFNTFDILTVSRDALEANLYLHGKLFDTDIDTTPTSINGNRDFRFGAYTNTATALLRGGIAEFIHYNRKLSPSEIKKVECYLVTKYDLINDNCIENPLLLHLDADSLTDADGSQIATWTDQSGNGFDAIQTESNRQPLLIHNAVNSKKTLRFDGGDDYLELPELYRDVNSTVITVQKRVNNGTETILSDFGNSGVERLNYYIDSNDRFRYFYGDDDNHSLIDITYGPTDDFFIASATVDGQQGAAYNNNEKVNTSSTSFDQNMRLDGATDKPLVGALGSSNGTSRSQYFGGDIAEVIIYDRPLTQDEYKQVRCYLADKYGIDEIISCGPALLLNLDANTLSESNGSPIATWVDQSSNTLDATQSTPGNQPTVVENAINGNKVVRFDGVDDYLELPEFLDSKQVTMYIVGTKNDDNGYLFYDGDDGNDFLLTRFFSDSFYGYIKDDIFNDSGNISNLANGQNFVSKINAADNEEIFISLNKDSTEITGTTSFPGADLSPSIGGISAPNSESQFSGDIAQILIFDGSLSEKQQTEIECYLSQRYSIANNGCFQDAITLYLDPNSIDTDDPVQADGNQILSWNGISNNQNSLVPDNITTETTQLVDTEFGKAVFIDGPDVNAQKPVFTTNPFSSFIVVDPQLNSGRLWSSSSNFYLYLSGTSYASAISSSGAVWTPKTDKPDLLSVSSDGSPFVATDYKINGEFNGSGRAGNNTISSGSFYYGTSNTATNYYEGLFVDKYLDDGQQDIINTTLISRYRNSNRYKYSNTHRDVVVVNDTYPDIKPGTIVTPELVNPAEGSRLVVGLDKEQLVSITSDNITGSTVARWNNIFALDVSGEPETVLSFDFDKHLGGAPMGNNYELLYRQYAVEDFNPVTTSNTSINGSVISFDIASSEIKDGFYTLGTTNNSTSPLSGPTTPDGIDDLTVSLNANYGEIDVAFTQPNGNGNTIVDYIIEYSTDNFVTSFIYDDGVSSNTSYTLDEMFYGPNYKFKVTAVTSTGELSAASNIDEVTFEPLINSVTPNIGAAEGGQQVVIQGYNFDSGGFQTVEVLNSSNQNLNDYVLTINYDSTSNVNTGVIDSQCQNLIAYINLELLPTWVDPDTCNTQNTKIYVKLDIPANTTIQVLLRTSDINESLQNPDEVFEFFDDFSGTSLDSNKWDSVGENTYFNISNGKLNLTGGNLTWNNPQLMSKSIFLRGNKELLFTYNNSCNSINNMIGWLDNTTPVGTGAWNPHNYRYYFYNTNSFDHRVDASGISTSSYSCNKTQYARIRLKPDSGAFFDLSEDNLNWVTTYESSANSDSLMRVGFTGYAGAHTLDNFIVKPTESNEVSYNVLDGVPNKIGDEIKIDGNIAPLVSSQNGEVTIEIPPANITGNGLGSKDITITNNKFSTSYTLPNGYTYVAPTINAINPAIGSPVGGYEVTLSGTNFPLKNRVTGEQTITISNDSGSTITDAEVFVTFNSLELVNRGYLAATCQNLRTRIASGSDINHYLQFGCNTENTGLWIKIPNLATGETQVELYFAVASDPSLSDINNFSFGSSLSNSALWLDANQITPTSSDKVDVWTDQSGNNRDVTQTIEANQPTLVTDSLNNLPVVDFDGNDGLLNVGSTPLTSGDDDFSYYVVWSSDVIQTSTIYEQNSNSIATGQRAALLRANSQYGFNGESNDFNSTAPAPAIGSYTLSTIHRFDQASSNVEVITNDTSYVGSIDNTVANVSSDRFGVGFKTSANNEYLDGKIAEILVFDTNQSANQSVLENYLNTKYRIFNTQNIPEVTSIEEKQIELNIEFGAGNLATNISVNDSQTISLIAPESALAGDGTGQVSVTLTTPYGNSVSTTFDYSAPQINSLSVNEGSVEGGESLTINGSGFTNQINYQKVTLDNSTNPNTLTDYQFKIEVDTQEYINENLLDQDCIGLSMVDTDQTTRLPFWVEEDECGETDTDIWVKLDSLTANSIRDIYIELDQARTTSLSNGDGVFLLFDDFEGESLDTTKWSDHSDFNSTMGNGYYEVVKDFSGTGYFGFESLEEFGLNTRYETVIETANLTNNYNFWNTYGEEPSTNDISPGNTIYIVSSSGLKFRGQNRISSASTVTLDPFINGVHNLEIIRDPAGTIFRVNDTSSTSVIANLPTTDMHVGTGLYFGSNWIINDAFIRVHSAFVRNHFDIEPNISVESQLEGTVEITIGSNEVLGYEFIDTGTYNVVVPPSTLPGTAGIGDGVVDVTYTGADGLTVTLPNSYEYKLPELISISPVSGPDQGGNDVVFSGNYLASGNFVVEFSIDNQTGSAITNYEEAIEFDTKTLVSEGKLDSNCSELNVVTSTGSPVNYYLDGGCNSKFSALWIHIPNLQTGLTNYKIVYGGNNASSNQSNISPFSFATLLGDNELLYQLSAHHIDQELETNISSTFAQTGQEAFRGVVTNQPLLTTSTHQNFPTMFFDGDDYLETDYTGLVGTDYTLISYGYRTSNNARWTIGTSSLQNGLDTYLGYSNSGAQVYFRRFDDNPATITIPTFDGTLKNDLIIGTLDDVDGAQVFFNELSSSLVGGQFHLGGINPGRIGRTSTSTSDDFIGGINEVMIYTKVLDATERGVISDYFTKKYNLNPEIQVQSEKVVGITIDGLLVENLEFINPQTIIGQAPANTGLNKDVIYTSRSGNTSTLSGGYDYGTNLPPNAINDVSLTNIVTGVFRLDWSEPNNNGEPISDYIIEYDTDPLFGAPQVYSDGVSTSTSIIIDDLDALEEQHFRIKAVNSVGNGPASNIVTKDAVECNQDFAGQDWVINQNTLISGVYCNIDELRVEFGVIATIEEESSVQIYANSVNILGEISGTGAGFQANQSSNCNEFFGFGPGGGQSNIANTSGGGGAHGGVGGNGSNINANLGGQVMYGYIEYPTEFGSGGAAGRSNCGSPGIGGFGGGAIKIVTSDLVVDGTINTDGAPGVGGTTGYGNGYGAGGSIWIDTDTFSGTGTVTSDGGGGNTGTGNSVGGAGGGGRIAVYSETNTFSGAISAAGGVHPNHPERSGGAGTIYLKNTLTDNEQLIIRTGAPDQNGTLVDESTTININPELTIDTASVNIQTQVALDISSLAIDAGYAIDIGSLVTFSQPTDITLDGTLKFYGRNNHVLGDVVINDGGVVTHENNSDTHEHSIDISVNSLTINSGGTINADELGYGQGFGPGVGAVYGGGWSTGASHGGLGAPSDNSGGIPAPVYGSKDEPIELGSGATKPGIAGSGGGAIKITSTNPIINEGAITANAQNTNSDNGNGTASGGSIWLDAPAINGNGLIEARGGDTNNNVMVTGSGGRVALYYQDRQSTNINARSGLESDGITSFAEDGTIYEHQIPESGLSSASFDSIPFPVSINQVFDVRIENILNIYGNPVRQGIYDQVVCDVTVTGDGGNYAETITGGYVTDGVCILPSTFIAPTATGVYIADITVIGTDTAQTTETKTGITFNVAAEASNLAEAQLAPNETKPQFTTLTPEAVQLIGQETTITATGFVDSGNGQALNGIPCSIRITGPSSYDSTFVTSNIVGGECSYNFSEFELPSEAGTYNVEISLDGDDGTGGTTTLTTDSVPFDRAFDIELITGTTFGGNNTADNNPVIGDETNIFTSPIVYKYDGVTLIDEGTACVMRITDNAGLELFNSTINSSGQCASSVPPSTLTGASVDVVSQVDLDIDGTLYSFTSAQDTFTLVGSPSDLAKEDTGNPGQPVFTSQDSNIDPAFLNEPVTLTVNGLLDSITDQPLENATCNFAVTNPNTNSFVFNTTSASNGVCTITIPGVDLLDGGQEVEGTYSFILNIAGDSGTLTTPSVTFDRLYNIDLVGGFIPGSATTTPSPVVVGQTYSVRSARIYRYNGSTLIQNGFPCENEVVINSGSPQTVSGTTSSGYCNTTMPASGVTGNGTIVSRVTVAGQEFETGATPFEVKALNNAQICTLVFRDDTLDQSYDGGEELFAGNSVRLSGTNYTTTTLTTTNTGYVCFGSLFDGTYTLEILNGGPGGTQTLPVGGGDYTIILAPGDTQNRAFGFNGNAPVCPYPIFTDTNEDGIQNNGEASLVDAVNTLPLNLYAASDLVTPIDTLNANGILCFSDQSPGDYVVEMDIPAGMSSTGSGFTENGGKVTRPVTVGFGVQGDVAFSFSFDPTGDPVEDPVNPGQPINNGTVVNSSSTVYVGYNFDATTGGLLDTGNDAALEGLNGATCSMEFTGPSFPGGLVKSGVVTAGECYVDPVPDTAGPHGVTTTVDGPSGNPLTTIITTFDVVPNNIDICPLPFRDYNDDQIRNTNEPYIEGLTATLIDNNTTNTVATLTTDDQGFNCFEDVEAADVDDYQVTITQPPSSTETTTTGLSVNVDPLPDTDEDVFFGFKGVIDICVANVYMDNNSNQTQDGNEPGLPLHQYSLRDEYNNLIETVTTDAAGRGCVSELLDGTYEMNISDPNLNPLDTSLTGTQSLSRNVVAAAGSGNGANTNEYVESYGFQNDAIICPNPTFADYNKDGLFDNGEDEIGGLATRLYLGTNNTGTLLQTINTNGSLCFDAVATADTGGDFDFFIEQDVPTGGVLTSTTESYTFTQDFGKDVDKRFGYKGNATICPYPTFQDNNLNGVFDAEPTIDGVLTTLKDTTNTEIGSFITNHGTTPCFTELLESTYILSQERPSNTVSTTGGTIKNVVTTAGNQEDIAFGYDGRPLICPVVYRDDDANGLFDPNEFRFSQVDVTLRNSGGTLLETITSTSGERCFDTANTAIGDTFIVESLAFPNYVITTSIGNGSPNDNPDNTTALTFGQKYEPEFGYNGNGSICAQNVFEDFNANGIYDAGADTFLADGVLIELTTLQGSTDYGTVAISGGNACFNNVAPGQYSLDVVDADKPLGSISTTGGVQTIVLSPGQTQNFNYGFTGDVTICPQVTFEDVDYNGIYNPLSESQLSGITVNLYRGTNLTTPYDTLTLSGSGTECFNGLFADDYRVEQVDVDTVFTGQYWNTTEATQSGTDPDDYYVDLTTVSQDYITQEFGYTQNPDFTLGAIFGFLFVDRAEDDSYDIAGADNFELTVFDNDVPVVDQTVLLYKFNTTTSLFEEIDSTVSDAEGNYRFDKLGVGDYEVRIPNNSLVGIKSVTPDPSIRAYTITNDPVSGLNDKFYDAELSFQFTARICPFIYIDLNEDGNYDVGSDYSITDNEGAEYGLSYVSFNGSQSAGTFNSSGGACAEELPPRDYTVTLSNPFGTATSGAFGPSGEYPVNFYDQFDVSSWDRTVYLASEITDIETRLFSQVTIDRTASQIEGRIWHNRPIYGSGNPFEDTYDVDGGDDKTETNDDPGNSSGFDYDYDNDFGYGGVTLELIKCYDGFQDPVPTTVWNANPPTTVTDSDGFYRFDDTNVNFSDGMGGFYNLIPGDYAVIRQGALPNESSLTGVRAKQCEHIGVPTYALQSIFFNNYPNDAPQAPSNRTPITPGTTVTQNEMLFYDGVIENDPYIDQSQNLIQDGTERSCYVQNCPSAPTPSTHVYGEFELRDQSSGDILAIVPYNVKSGAISTIGYSGTDYGGIPGIIPGNYEVEMINIEPLDGMSQPYYTEIQPGELIKSHTQLNQEENLYDYGFEPLFGTFIEGYVYIDRNSGTGVDLDGVDNNLATDFDNDEPLQGYTVQIFDSADNLVGTETTDVNGFWNYTPGGQGLPEGAYTMEVIDTPPTGTNCGNCSTSTFISVLGGSPSATNRNMRYVYEGYIGSDAFVDNDNDGDIERPDEASTFWPDGREIAIRNTVSDNSRVWDYQVYLYYEKGTAQEYLVVDDYTTPTCGVPSVNVCVDLDNLTTAFFMSSNLKPGTYTLDLVINDPSLTLTTNSTGILSNVITLGPKGKNWVRWAFNPRTNNSVTGNVFVDRGTLNEVYDPAGEDGLVGTGNDADSFDNELALQNATVKIHGPNGTIVEADAVTDVNGNYTITGLETGLYRLYDTDPNNNLGSIPFIETTDTIINTLRPQCITFYGCYGLNGSGFATALSRGTVLEVGTDVTNNMTYIYTNSLAAYSVEDLNGDGVISTYSNGDFDTIVGNQDYEIEHINTGKVLTCDGNNYADLDPLNSNSYGGGSVCFWQALPAEWNGTPSEFEVRKLANLPDLDLVVTRRISGIFGPSSNGLSLGPVDSASYTFNQFGLNQQQAFAFYQAQGVVTNNASITGFAFIDINGDSIYQPNGLDGDPQTIEDNETPLVDTSYILSGDIDRTVDAGSLGQYQFTDLPQGNYTVTSDIDPGTVSYSMRIIGAVVINDAVNGDYYRVTFSTQGFEPTVGGRHLRFYWDTEDTSVTGQEVFDTGPYEVPIVNRPPGANQICAVIMEGTTTPIPNSGDCEPLP